MPNHLIDIRTSFFYTEIRYREHMDIQDNIRVGYRWLGAAGVALRVDGQTLLIDPYISRLPWHHMFFRCIQPNRQLVGDTIGIGNHILVSHSHVDHLLDVPVIVDYTGAEVYGSQNTCSLLSILGVSASKIHLIGAGNELSCGLFKTVVYPARHYPIPFFMPGNLDAHLHPPLTARQYRMDVCFSFLIEADGMRILVDSGRRKFQHVPADVLIINPFYRAGYYQKQFKAVQPKLVIPNHWDNFMAAFFDKRSKNSYSQDWVSALIARFLLPRFRRIVQTYSPGVKIIIPQLFREIDLSASIAG